MKRVIGFALLLSGGAAVGGTPFDARSAAPIALERISALTDHRNTFRLAVTDTTSADGIADNGTIRLSRASLAEVHSSPELDALLAVLIAFSRPGAGQDPATPAKAGLADYAAATAFAAAADKVDPINQRDPTDRDRRLYTFQTTIKTSDQDAGTARGRTALVLLSKAGSCSGAALTVLDRLQTAYRRLPEGDRPPLSLIASRIRLNFGAAALPPDMSCVN